MTLPESRQCSSLNGYRTTPTLATCFLLHRLAIPARWIDMEALFGKFAPQLEKIFRKALQKIINAQKDIISGKVSQRYFAMNGKQYSREVYVKCHALEHFVAIIDGTVIESAQPGGCGSSQQTVNNSHKGKHVLKFQAIITSDSLCALLYGSEARK